MYSNILCGFALIATLFSSSVWAEETAAATIDPEKKAAIQELIAVMNFKAMAPSVMQQMMEQTGPAMEGVAVEVINQNKQLSESQKQQALKKLEADLPAMQHEMEQIVSGIDFAGIINDVYLDIYTQHFTAGEIRDLVAFYRSPTGKKVVSTMPQIMAEATPLVTKRMLPTISQGVAAIAERHAKTAMAN